MRRPFRIWMTGCFAVVVAALGGGRVDAAERGSRSRAPLADARVSRFSATETVHRLEACAARHGFTVFARLDAAAARAGEAEGCSVIVFESSSSRGGTPVLMDGPHARPDLPLAVRVRGTAAGASEVWLASTAWDDLPDDLTRDLIELPALVDDALS